MEKINWGRLILGSLVAAIIMFVTDGFMHEALLKSQFIPLGFFSNALWLKAGAIHLITTIVATIAGAALYKDARSRAVA